MNDENRTEIAEGAITGPESRLTELAAELLELRAAEFKRKGELKAIGERKEVVYRETYELLTPLERTKFDFQEKMFALDVDSYPSIIPGKDFEFFDWLDEHGEGGIAKRTIHVKTLPSWYAKHPEFAEELTAYLKTFEKIKIVVYGDHQQEQTAQAYEEWKRKA